LSVAETERSTGFDKLQPGFSGKIGGSQIKQKIPSGINVKVGLQGVSC
jgi:hypothetical protein